MPPRKPRIRTSGKSRAYERQSVDGVSSRSAMSNSQPSTRRQRMLERESPVVTREEERLDAKARRDQMIADRVTKGAAVPEVAAKLVSSRPRGSGTQQNELTVRIRELEKGSCSYVPPATVCMATSTYEALLSFVEEPVTYLWTIVAGTATVLTPTERQCSVQTVAGDDQAFTLRCDVTDASGAVFAEEQFSHQHEGEAAPESRATQSGDTRVTQAADTRIIHG